MHATMSPPAAPLRDDIDWSLIRLLRLDGRATYESLAQDVGLSKAAARSRILKLLSDDSVRVVGVAHPSLLGMSHSARVSLDTNGPSLPVARQIAEQIGGAVLVALSTGPRAVLVELRLDSLKELDDAITELRKLPNVTASETAIYTTIHRDQHVSTHQTLDVKLDALDLQIIALLQRDGRMPFAEIAAKTGMSPASARMRTLRLIECAAVSVQTLVAGTSHDTERLAGFALDVRYDAGFSVDQVLEVEGVSFLATSLGWADVFGSIRVDSFAQIAAVTEAIRAVNGVERVHSWVHFEVVKEDYERAPAPPGAGSGHS